MGREEGTCKKKRKTRILFLKGKNREESAFADINGRKENNAGKGNA